MLTFASILLRHDPFYTFSSLMIPIFLLLGFFSFEAVFAIKWLSVLQTAASLGSIESAGACGNLSGVLSRRQLRICARNVELMDSVRVGAHLALLECQWQFKYSPWNCSAEDLFGKSLLSGTRESAFVHAVSSAGVAHAVTRACSSGRLVRCGCDRTVPAGRTAGFQWSGCSDNVAFGTAFAKSFVDANDARRARAKADPRAVVNLQNNEAGRKIVEYGMRIECKCHGASGSCQTRTCWRALPDFRAVSADLRSRFASAARVRAVGRRLAAAERPLADTDLVFLRPSPDRCGATAGRECASQAVCERLCCGSGGRHAVRRTVVAERCGCKFHWCCHVTCKECETERMEYYCL